MSDLDPTAVCWQFSLIERFDDMSGPRIMATEKNCLFEKRHQIYNMFTLEELSGIGAF